MAFAARLASKRKAEEGGGGGSDAGDDVETEEQERGLGRGGMSSLLQGERDETIRNPFADDEEEDEDSDEGSDDGDLGAGPDGAGGAGGGSSWNRGGWWRGALGGRKKKASLSNDNETFGDGRDSSSGEDEAAAGERGEGGNSSEEDEEFGDFAMPEQAGGAGIDAEREKVLVKPLPVHPSAGAGGPSGNKGLMGLWPFMKKDKDATKEGVNAVEDPEKTGERSAEGIEKPAGDAGGEKVAETEEAKAEEPPVVLSEDGEKVQAAVEAKRRTSIEEPDEGEDEVVV